MTEGVVYIISEVRYILCIVYSAYSPSSTIARGNLPSPQILRLVTQVPPTSPPLGMFHLIQ